MAYLGFYCNLKSVQTFEEMEFVFALFKSAYEQDELWPIRHFTKPFSNYMLFFFSSVCRNFVNSYHSLPTVLASPSLLSARKKERRKGGEGEAWSYVPKEGLTFINRLTGLATVYCWVSGPTQLVPYTQ